MTPLSDALTAAQRRALAALEKAYVAGAIEAEKLREGLHSCGVSDDVDISYLTHALDVLKEWGAQLPAEPNGRLDLYVVGVCSRCHFALTGEDEEREATRSERAATRR